MYDIYDIAEYVIKRCNEQGKSISNLKLQKILYFIQAAFLVRVGKPAFDNEIEAWDLGPVVPAVYVKYRLYGSASIPYIDMGIRAIDFPFDRNYREIMDSIISNCAPYSAIQLAELTQKQDPWLNAYSKLKSKHRHNIISKDSIRKFFEE